MLNLLLVIAAFAVSLAAFDLYAQEVSSGRGPFDLALLGTYGWIIVVSLMGGFASFYQKVKKGQTRWVNLGELLGELVTAALAGLLTYWLCRAAGLSEWWTAAFVGIGGHMGSRTLFLLERVLERWLERIGGHTPTSAPADPVPSRGTPGDQR